MHSLHWLVCSAVRFARIAGWGFKFPTLMATCKTWDLAYKGRTTHCTKPSGKRGKKTNYYYGLWLVSPKTKCYCCCCGCCSASIVLFASFYLPFFLAGCILAHWLLKNAPSGVHCLFCLSVCLSCLALSCVSVLSSPWSIHVVCSFTWCIVKRRWPATLISSPIPSKCQVLLATKQKTSPIRWHAWGKGRLTAYRPLVASYSCQLDKPASPTSWRCEGVEYLEGTIGLDYPNVPYRQLCLFKVSHSLTCYYY